MAMSVGSSGGEEELNSTINTTPLVDVMLVLLIIFLITIPVINKTVKVSLPKAANIATQTKPENITVAVDSQGNIYWNNEQVANRDQLIEMIKLEASKTRSLKSISVAIPTRGSRISARSFTRFSVAASSKWGSSPSPTVASAVHADLFRSTFPWE